MRLRQLNNNEVEEAYDNVYKDFSLCACGKFHSLRNEPSKQTLKWHLFLLFEGNWKKNEEQGCIYAGHEVIDIRLLIYITPIKFKLPSKRR
jgi:hypothetical protein